LTPDGARIASARRLYRDDDEPRTTYWGRTSDSVADRSVEREAPFTVGDGGRSGGAGGGASWDAPGDAEQHAGAGAGEPPLIVDPFASDAAAATESADPSASDTGSAWSDSGSDSSDTGSDSSDDSSGTSY
jgi:hypothetical protein